MTDDTILPDDPGAGLRALLAEGRYQEVLAAFRELPSDQVKAEVQLIAATAATRLGDLRLATALAEAALDRFRSRADEDGRMRASNLLGVLSFERGNLTRARGHFGEALDIAGRLQDSLMTARASNNLASIADLVGDPEEALSLYRYALLNYQRLGDRRGAAESYHNLGIVFRQMREWDDAVSSATEAVRHAEMVQEPALVALAVGGRAEIDLRRGDSPMARREVLRAGSLAEQAGDELGAIEAARLQALVDLTDGDHETAAAGAEAARRKAESAHAPLLQAECAAAAARALKALGRRADADIRYREAVALFENLGARRRLEDFRLLWEES